MPDSMKGKLGMDCFVLAVWPTTHMTVLHGVGRITVSYDFRGVLHCQHADIDECLLQQSLRGCINMCIHAHMWMHMLEDHMYNPGLNYQHRHAALSVSGQIEGAGIDCWMRPQVQWMRPQVNWLRTLPAECCVQGDL
jgi:hypothetical protein